MGATVEDRIKPEMSRFVPWVAGRGARTRTQTFETKGDAFSRGTPWIQVPVDTWRWGSRMGRGVQG